MECLDKIIKLSRTECNCFDADKPIDYNSGQYDLYIDELQGFRLKTLQDSADCESGNMWEVLNWSREEAIKQFVSDYQYCAMTKHKLRREPTTGIVGGIGWNMITVPNTALAGVEVKAPMQQRGMYMTVKRIGALFNNTSSVVVSVYDNDLNQTTPIGTYTIPTTANALSYGTLATPLKLPLWSENVSDLRYYFVYSVGVDYPLNNKTNCVPCSGVRPKYLDWVDIRGIRGASLTTLNTSTELNGLVLDASFSCESDFICGANNALDFVNDGKAKKIAEAIRYQAGLKAVQRVLDSGNINRYTMVDRESLYGSRNHYAAEYKKLMEVLCSDLDLCNEPCYACKGNSNFVKGRILS